MAAAKAVHRPVEQILEELMRELVQRQREAREYDEFLGRKVDTGRASMHAGVGHSNDKVEAPKVKRCKAQYDQEIRLQAITQQSTPASR